MPFEITIVTSVQSGGTTISKANKYSGSLQVRLDEIIAASQTNFEIEFSLDVSATKAIYMVASQDLTLKTNDSGSPIDTIELVANKPYEWDVDSYNDCLLSADVSKFYVTNATGNSATLQVEAVVDATP